MRQTGGLACRSGAVSGQVDTTHAPGERLGWASMKYCGYIAAADAYPAQQNIHAVVTQQPGQPARVPFRARIPTKQHQTTQTATTPTNKNQTTTTSAYG